MNKSDFQIIRFLIVLPLVAFLFVWTGCPDISEETPNNVIGAAVPFLTYEAEDAVFTGTLIQGKTYRTVEGEASGKAAVRLDNNGQYVEFTLIKPANALVVRYAMPDTDGKGQNGSLEILANGTKIGDLPTTSRFAATYGNYPFTNNQAPDRRIRFYDDGRMLLPQTYPAGTRIAFRKNDHIEWYVIDMAEFEAAPPPLSPPSGNYVSILSHGGNGNGIADNRAALNNAITAARNAGHRTVWIPAGTYHISGTNNINVNGIKIFGSGIWHTTLAGGAYFYVQGSNNHFSNFAILGSVTERVDSNRHCGFEPFNSSNDIYENLWIEHTKCGIWAVNMRDSIIRNNRIRNNYADGINLASNSRNNIVEHNDLRNHGDDGIAINSENNHHNVNNMIRNNTVRLTYHASLLAIYGGGGNTLQDNLLVDTIAFGAAINISSRFNPQGFRDTTTITGNVAYRTGSAAGNNERNRNSGAIWLVAWDKDFGSGTINITNNRLIDNLYDGITIDGTRAINNTVNFRDNSIEKANGFGVLIHGGNNLSGSAAFFNTSVTGATSGAFRNNRSQFTVIDGGGNSW